MSRHKFKDESEDGLDEAGWNREMAKPIPPNNWLHIDKHEPTPAEVKESTVRVAIAPLPADITESIRSVLACHGLVLVRAGDTQYPFDRTDAVLREMGRNAAQVVMCNEVAE